MNRDPVAERRVTGLAADAAGHPLAASRLDAFADARALDAPVRPRSIDEWIQEIAEEIADARNYVVWLVRSIEPAFLRGESWACDVYDRAMRCLVGLIAAWAALT